MSLFGGKKEKATKTCSRCKNPCPEDEMEECRSEGCDKPLCPKCYERLQFCPRHEDEGKCSICGRLPKEGEELGRCANDDSQDDEDEDEDEEEDGEESMKHGLLCPSCHDKNQYCKACRVCIFSVEEECQYGIGNTASDTCKNCLLAKIVAELRRRKSA